MKNKLKSLLNQLPYIRGLVKKVANYDKNACYPAGHYYSPIINVTEIKSKEDIIWKKTASDIVKGVNLNTSKQLELIAEFNKYYNEIPFKANKQDKLRYFFDNKYYSYTDGIMLYNMMRHIKPKQIIEVGSGFSSALMLDVNDVFFESKIKLTFIEPYTERLESLLSEKDKTTTTILKKFVQEVSLDEFKKLEAGDILFIDSTHVCKTGSDVNFLFFEVLPILKNGVYVHIHDVFYPFEYPKDWVYGGRNWNEDYLLRAFLMFNNTFEIKIFSHYLHTIHKEVFNDMPLTYKNFGGNIWLEKVC
ncbi:MAG: hypothetical protein KFKLKKLM_01902 [Flavobacteriales bacterium]|nr:hypothetical protein [Flavobacteriales bacterium]